MGRDPIAAPRGSVRGASSSAGAAHCAAGSRAGSAAREGCCAHTFRSRGARKGRRCACARANPSAGACARAGGPSSCADTRCSTQPGSLLVLLFVLFVVLVVLVVLVLLLLFIR